MKVYEALTLAMTAASCLQSIVAQTDGNPHEWDRRRRCDHVAYDPPCGVCEGYGGIPTGDNNEEITLTTCTAVKNATEIENPVWPLWTDEWEVDNYYEVLIGHKTDPFCFSVIPGGDSIGELCYRADYGAQYYDMGVSKTLRFDLNSKTVVGNVTSNIIHNDVDFWIVNKFPWYALGTHQCICTHVQENGVSTAPLSYPVNPDWTKQMSLIGLETIGIEYTNQEKTLNHFAFGPHHVWSDPTSGQIYRMWQPFNGLQVFPEGIKQKVQDPTRFNTPPPLCKKKGGATFRVGCDDDGYTTKPIPGAASITAKPTELDMRRAKTAVPRPSYRGENFAHMSDVLNGWLVKGKAATRACEDYTTAELQELQALLFMVRDVEFDDVYQAASDNRRIRDSMKQLEGDWESLNTVVSGYDADHVVHDIRRDGHCHEAVMWFVHHLAEDVKTVLAESGVVIPLLSKNYHELPEGADDGVAAVHRVYEDQVTCASCHADYSK